MKCDLIRKSGSSVLLFRPFRRTSGLHSPLPPTMTFSSASFNTAPLSIVPTSCTAVFPGRRNLACGAGHNVSRLRRWWWQWRWQWWYRPLPTRSTLLSSVSTQNPLTFHEIFFVATQGSHIEFTYLGCHS